MDVAVLVESDSAAEQLVRSLTADGYRLGALVEQDAVGRLATVRLLSPGADGVGVVVDLIFATVASVLGPLDRTVARTAVELIMKRGFARGRSLPALLDKYLDAGTA